MENQLNNLPPFYIGQKVVSLQTHKGQVKGEIYTVTGVFQCVCKSYLISWGAPHGIAGARCNCHNCCSFMPVPSNNPYWVAPQEYFAPIQENPFPSLTMKQVIKKEAPLVCMN